MTIYDITAVDLRSGHQEKHTIAATNVRAAVQEFADAFPHTRVIAAKPQ